MVMCLFVLFIASSVMVSVHSVRFEAIEHKNIGDTGYGEAKLVEAEQTNEGTIPDVGDAVLSAGGKELTFGDIVALAGDFYEHYDEPERQVSNKAIPSVGRTYDVRSNIENFVERFENAFDSLKNARSAELNAIFEAFAGEAEAAKEKHAGYERLGNEGNSFGQAQNQKYSFATGGGNSNRMKDPSLGGPDAPTKKFQGLMSDSLYDILTNVICTVDTYTGPDAVAKITQAVTSSSATMDCKNDFDGILIRPGRFMQLALFNNDHFGQTAHAVYRIGLRAAMQDAYEAGMSDDVEKLKSALAKAAFACHFLTDLFASGHLRTPRKLMAEKLGDVAGGLFAKCMHDEDNFNGLVLPVSSSAETPRAIRSFGDSFYFEKYNAGGAKGAIESVSRSVKSIFDAYKRGVSSPDSSFSFLTAEKDSFGGFPGLDVTPSLRSAQNKLASGPNRCSPMFRPCGNGELCVRKNLNTALGDRNPFVAASCEVKELKSPVELSGDPLEAFERRREMAGETDEPFIAYVPISKENNCGLPGVSVGCEILGGTSSFVGNHVLESVVRR